MAMTKEMGRVLLLLRKYSPQIFMALGISTFAGTVITVHQAAKEVDGVLDETKQNINRVKLETHHVTATESERVGMRDQELVKAYFNGALELAKLYGPSILLGGASIACFVGGQSVLSRRNAALASAYALADGAFSKYRKRVIDELGAQKDRAFMTGMKEKTVSRQVEGKDGKKKRVKEKVLVVDEEENGLLEASRYAVWFNSSNPNWQPGPGYNETFLNAKERQANDLFLMRGYLFLNEAYESLGFPATPEGQLVGWVYDPNNTAEAGDNFVDFGIFEAFGAGHEHEPGKEPGLFLDFNVDGVIWDLI